MVADLHRKQLMPHHVPHTLCDATKVASGTAAGPKHQALPYLATHVIHDAFRKTLTVFYVQFLYCTGRFAI